MACMSINIKQYSDAPLSKREEMGALGAERQGRDLEVGVGNGFFVCLLLFFFGKTIFGFFFFFFFLACLFDTFY